MHLAQFTRELATLVSAGIPLLQSLQAMGLGPRPQPIPRILTFLQERIAMGGALHAAMTDLSVFSTLYCQLVAAGELSGNLDAMLHRLALHTERQYQLQRKVRMALVYPIAVMTIALVVVSVILVWVVPVFQSIFASYGADLPWATRLVLGMSHVVLHLGPTWVTLLVLSGWLCLAQYRRRASWQWQVARLQLRLPVIAPLVSVTNLAIWTRCLSMLLQSGVPLLEALATVADACPHPLFAASTRQVREAVWHGHSLSDAMRGASPSFGDASGQTQGLFTPILLQMVAVGEQSGALVSLLGKAADALEDELAQLVHAFTQLLEPVMIVVLGVLVGGLVIALYLPVFQMGQVM
jgi:type IV pilus assembly protein PilC